MKLKKFTQVLQVGTYVSVEVFATGHIGWVLLSCNVAIAIASRYRVQQDCIGIRITRPNEPPWNIWMMTPTESSE
jgi:hypothetical protein